MRKVSEITGMSAHKGVLFVEVGEQGREHKAGSVNCQVLHTEGDEELAEIIAERFNALASVPREELAYYKEMVENNVGNRLLDALTGLSDAVKKATPEGEALPQPLLDAMKQADELLAEIAKYDEQNETPPQP